jgi:quinol monooxygenase YgiN
MTGTFAYVGNWTVKEGKVEEVRNYLAAQAEVVETNEPRLISFNFYLDEDTRRVSCVQVHPDAASMAAHVELITKHLNEAMDWIDTIELEQYFGEKSSKLAELLEPWSGPHIPERYLPEHVAGFTRSTVR